MYTEENEFDYDAYLEENSGDDGDNQDNKNNSTKSLITKIVLIVLLLILIMFLFFNITNNLKKKNNKEEKVVDSSLVFDNNINKLKNIGEDYFFKNNNLPKNTKDKIMITVKELIDKKIIKEVLDYDSKVCGYNTSYISITKNKNDYMMEIYLNCPSNDEKRVYYYDLEFNCLTCNGENYISSDTDTDTDSKEENNNSNSNNNDKPTTSLVCDSFGEWTTEYKDDVNLDRQTRTLVKGYKDTLKFGEWSEETTEPLKGSNTLQVTYEIRPVTVTTKGEWSKKTTKKPKEKEGRTIKSWTEQKPYYTKSCKDTTYTVERSTWDNNALKCTASGIGKVTCTYKKQECSNVKKYKTVTYYKYQDTITETRNQTYYKAGYTKLDNSELIQYRYRTKCVK